MAVNTKLDVPAYLTLSLEVPTYLPLSLEVPTSITGGTYRQNVVCQQNTCLKREYTNKQTNKKKSSCYLRLHSAALSSTSFSSISSF